MSDELEGRLHELQRCLKDLEESSEPELLARLQDNEAIFEAWHALLEPPVSGLVRKFLGSNGTEDDVEDIVQETFLGFYRRLGTFRGEVRLKTFLYVIAKNKVVDFLRRAFTRAIIQGIDEAAESDSLAYKDTSLDSKELGEVMFAALRETKDEHRDVLYLRLCEDLSPRVIAEILNRPCVKNLLRRARVELRTILARSEHPDVVQAFDLNAARRRRA